MWFRVDDKFPDHPKCQGLEGVHLGVWLAGGCWSSAFEKNGFIPQQMAFRIAARLDPRARTGLLGDEPQVLRELVSAGLWHRAKDGYKIHDFLDYNPSKKQLRAARKARSEGGRRAAQIRWNSGTERVPADSSSHSSSHGNRIDTFMHPARPGPSHPYPNTKALASPPNSNGKYRPPILDEPDAEVRPIPEPVRQQIIQAIKRRPHADD